MAATRLGSCRPGFVVSVAATVVVVVDRTELVVPPIYQYPAF